MGRWNRPEIRAWIYLVTCAALGVVSVYGWVDEKQLAAWTTLGAAITGMAWLNTSGDDSVGKRFKDE